MTRDILFVTPSVNQPDSSLVDESGQSGLSIIQSACFKFGGEKTKNKKNSEREKMDRKQQHKFSSKKDEKKLQRREVNVQVSYRFFPYV